jgi:hypothetical protein
MSNFMFVPCKTHLYKFWVKIYHASLKRLDILRTDALRPWYQQNLQLILQIYEYTVDMFFKICREDDL